MSNEFDPVNMDGRPRLYLVGALSRLSRGIGSASVHHPEHGTLYSDGTVVPREDSITPTEQTEAREDFYAQLGRAVENISDAVRNLHGEGIAIDTTMTNDGRTRVRVSTTRFDETSAADLYETVKELCEAHMPELETAVDVQVGRPGREGERTVEVVSDETGKLERDFLVVDTSRARETGELVSIPKRPKGESPVTRRRQADLEARQAAASEIASEETNRLGSRDPQIGGMSL